jgi:aminoglycoside phosphotransferase (APT) family kinase protein
MEESAVAEAVAVWAGRQFGGTVSQAEPPTLVETGYDNLICFVRFTGDRLPEPWRAPLVARAGSSPDRFALAQREAAIQNWCVETGLPAPAVLAVIQPGDALNVPIQVMQRAPGRTVLAEFIAAPWRAPTLINRLAELQARLHIAPTDDFPRTSDDSDSFLDRRLALVRHVVATIDVPELARALQTVEEMQPRLSDAPAVVCHGDFHALNVIVDGDNTSIIDWTDAGLGDRHGDVARTLLLFEIAAVGAESRQERLAMRLLAPWLKRRYQRAYEHHLPLDTARLRLWAPAHYLHLWAGVVATQSELIVQRQKLPAGFLQWARARFFSSLAVVTSDYA